jgi:protein-disulfide isomerase
MAGLKVHKDEKPETKENIVAVGVFLLIILIVAGLFTHGFGLFSSPAADRVKVLIGDAPTTGNPNAKVHIIAYSDFECPFCQRAESTLSALRQQYGDKISYSFKNFPLTQIHPDAMNAALAAECANEQDKFWEYHDYLFSHNTALSVADLKSYAATLGLKADQFNSCLDSQKYSYKINADLTEGRNLGVTSTPTFFINGIPIIGAQPASEFTKVIDNELK